MQFCRTWGSWSSAEDSHDDAFGAGERAAEGVEERGLAGGDAAGDDDVLASPDGGGEEVGGVAGEEIEVDEFVEGAGGEPEAADRADGVAVGGDGWDRGGEPGAVREPGFDAWGDAVEAFALDVFEDAVEERADLAVVDRSRLPGRCGRVGVGRVERGVRSLLAKDIDEHVKLAGGKANADVVGRPLSDQLHDSCFRDPRARLRLFDAGVALV
jgi:hypothetical protein